MKLGKKLIFSHSYKSVDDRGTKINPPILQILIKDSERGCVELEEHNIKTFIDFYNKIKSGGSSPAYVVDNNLSGWARNDSDDNSN